MRPDFGGNEDELEAMHAYHKALAELKSRGSQLLSREDAEEDAGGEDGGADAKGAGKRRPFKKKGGVEIKACASVAITPQHDIGCAHTSVFSCESFDDSSDSVSSCNRVSFALLQSRCPS